MRFAADENLPQGVIRRLRELGYEVADVKREKRELLDKQVMEKAGEAIVLSFDKDFMKDEELKKGRAVVFDFPGKPSKEVLPYIEGLVKYLEKEALPKKFLLVVRGNEMTMTK